MPLPIYDHGTRLLVEALGAAVARSLDHVSGRRAWAVERAAPAESRGRPESPIRDLRGRPAYRQSAHVATTHLKVRGVTSRPAALARSS
jgi:hypothetical protein